MQGQPSSPKYYKTVFKKSTPGYTDLDYFRKRHFMISCSWCFWQFCTMSGVRKSKV